jgi:hypothetical protein
MSDYRIKLAGTTKNAFQIGINGVTISTTGFPWTLTLPDNAGTAGQVLTTNGSGITTWTNTGSDSAVPYFIPVSQTYTVAEYKQALFAVNIDVEGTLEVNGILCEVN